MLDVVIDSSIIIGIVHLYMKNAVKPRDKREIQLFKIKDLLEDRKINCIVTPTIKKEILRGWRHDNGLGEKVISRFCSSIEFDDLAEARALQLTDSYGNVEINGMPAIPGAEDYLCPNYNDASIVAETSILQKLMGKEIPLITDNLKDVCDQNKINQINRKNNIPIIQVFSMRTLDDALSLARKNNKTM